MEARPEPGASPSSSGSVLSAQDIFRSKIQHPTAAPLLNAMKAFVRQLESAAPREPAERTAERVREHFRELEEAICAHPLWLDCEFEELERAWDAIEKHALRLVHSRVFIGVPHSLILATLPFFAYTCHTPILPTHMPYGCFSGLCIAAVLFYSPLA